MFRKALVLLMTLFLVGFSGSFSLASETLSSFSVENVVIHEQSYPRIDGVIWDYFSHDYVDPSLREYCQSNFGVGVVSTRIGLCVEDGNGNHHWEHYLSSSCDRLCTTCPKQTHPEYGCGLVTCSSGWHGDITGCLGSSKGSNLPPTRMPPIELAPAE